MSLLDRQGFEFDIFVKKDCGVDVFSTLVLQTTCQLRDVSCTNLTIVFEQLNIFPRPNYCLWCKKICLLPGRIKVMKQEKELTTCSLGTE